ncbi:3-oxoacyl-[acyl-carrier protein] reductase [Capronia epimyces CBS 606.96]|uniref:3-oxoacyl-[acyl-carrier protein] reductase n=1 Tax=Capronia epimyces CBS 606.96 TaxID=1182542 RepID=W9YLJ9_9EURO|nr:3-oxoacyl-[acyl-carrier protein] reductase [Capronia epimyces CBS 606.96]EXJ90121.1 3-oxoacyl-[acyl-carrier protein] reductase [Capronia epimyces CBS 606.96]
MPVDNDIRGRLALITGASGGIGAGCARDLYSQGCHLALTYSKNKANVDSLIADLPASTAGQRISSHQVDMASTEDIERLYKEIEAQHGHGPDIVIANAGHGKRIPQIQDISYEEFDYTVLINLRAPFVLAKLAVPHMAQQKWGRIIMMGSIAGYGGGINGCHYAASKAGLMGMVKNLAQKLAKDGITVNDVAPAMIGETGMIPDARSVEGSPGDVKNIPVGRLGTPQECANIVTTICKTGYLTGQSILLSGGLK